MEGLYRHFGTKGNAWNASDAQLPPSSLHSFLKYNRNIPGVLISNFETTYVNQLVDKTNTGYKFYEKIR